MVETEEVIIKTAALDEFVRLGVGVIFGEASLVGNARRTASVFLAENSSNLD